MYGTGELYDYSAECFNGECCWNERVVQRRLDGLDQLNGKRWHGGL